MITGTLILIAPLFWFSFMGAMGVAVGGDVVSRAFNRLNETGSHAAQEGGELIKSSAKQEIAIGKKLI
jgi:hypothetical protein